MAAVISLAIGCITPIRELFFPLQVGVASLHGQVARTEGESRCCSQGGMGRMPCPQLLCAWPHVQKSLIRQPVGVHRHAPPPCRLPRWAS